MDEMGLPLVVKIPDGSFSRGIHKIDTPEEFRRVAEELFEVTDLLLAQRFLPTQFDWRVGVLAGEPLFVCQYRMARPLASRQVSPRRLLARGRLSRLRTRQGAIRSYRYCRAGGAVH